MLLPMGMASTPAVARATARAAARVMQTATARGAAAGATPSQLLVTTIPSGHTRSTATLCS